MQTSSFTFLMTVEDDGSYIGFNGFTSLGSHERIAKQSSVPVNGALLGRADIDLNADFRVATGSAKPLGSAEEIVLTLEGYDVNVDGADATTSYGDPIRLAWDVPSETYSSVGTSSAQRASLLTFMQGKVGEDVRFSITEYTIPPVVAP